MVDSLNYSNLTIKNENTKYFTYENLYDYLILNTGDLFSYYKDNILKLAILVAIYIVCCVIFFIFLTRNKWLITSRVLKDARNVLLVTAHPDDECMFFGPTIVSLTHNPGVKVNILCLSRGDYDAMGQIRKDELWLSCAKLGIPESNIHLVNSSTLPDDPAVRWGTENVAAIILSLIEQLSIDTVITFDKLGVSYHLNHKSIFYGIAYLLLEKKLPSYTSVYLLESISLIRKYSFCIDSILSYFLSSKMFVAWGKQRILVAEAMQLHESQYVWFRKLYMFTSRYTCINTLRKAEVLDVELDLDLDEDQI